jgi:polyisoprenoid-binding protein YceI
MKTKSITGIILLWLAFIPLSVFSQDTYIVKSHEVIFEGTSNLQSWSAGVNELNGSFTIAVENGKITEVSDAMINIEAGSIDGSEGRRMNTKIYEALDIKNNPRISFILREVNSLAENPGTFRLNTKGVLTIAGVSRNVPLHVVGRVLPNGEVEFTGSQKILMSDHRVTPPTAMLGALRTGDEVILNYKVVLQKK